MKSHIRKHEAACVRLFCLIVLFTAISAAYGTESRGAVAIVSKDTGLKTVWQIGKADGGYGEFSTKNGRALQDKYDVKYAGGFDIYVGEKLKKDVFPGIQAGPGSDWAGNKTYPIRIHFKLDEISAGGYALVAATAGACERVDPALEVQVNKSRYIRQIKAGSGDFALSFQSTGESIPISIYVPASDLVKGDNEIVLTINGGFWVAYDYIRLETAEDTSHAALKVFSIDSPPFLVKRGDAVGQIIRANVISLGKSTEVTISADVAGRVITENVTLKPGPSIIKLAIPEQTTDVKASVAIESEGKKLLDAAVDIVPVRHVTIMLMPHSHLDIGYPDLQSNILIAQKRYLEQSLDMTERKDMYPMKWVAEISWLQWLLLNGIWTTEEYGKWMPETPLTRSVPDSFYKEEERLRNIAYKADIKSSAPETDGINERRAVDGSPMGWRTLGPARGSWLSLVFKKPEHLEYIAVRNGREDETNPIKYVRVSYKERNKTRSIIAGPLGADRERLLIPMGGKIITNFILSVESARYDDRPAALMEVEAWTKAAPDETIKRTLKAMKEGRMELAAMYMNFLTQLTPTEWLVRSMLRSNEVARAAGVDLKTAWITDVPGFSFAMPDVLAGSGVKYFYPALNADHAQNCLIDIPRAFIWEGPGGGRILVYHSFASYNEGWEHGFTRSVDIIEQKLPDFMKRLDYEKYPYDTLPLRTLGDITDDGPTAERLPYVVEEWNKRWAYPRVVIGTPHEFFEDFDKKYGKTLPTLRGDWTSYWEDGEGSTAMETILVRGGHRDLLNAGAFGAVQKRAIGPSPKLEHELKMAAEDLYLYDEHTWGADMSVTNPDSLQTTGQWHLKKMPAWDLRDRVETAKTLLRPVVDKFAPRPKHGGKIIAVLNSHGMSRGGVVELPFAASKDSVSVYDSKSGSKTESFLSSGKDGKRLFFEAKNVPPMGIAYYEIAAGNARMNSAGGFPAYKSGVMENSFFKITVDENTCRISSIYDKTAGRELTDSSDGYSMNEFIYVMGRDNANQKRLECLEVKAGASNAMFSEFHISGKAPRFPKITQTVRLYHKTNRIEFVDSLKKEETREKEGVYFAFPFNVPGGETRLEMTGGMMSLEKDQFKAASRDWISMQDAAGVVSDGYSALFSTPDAPLVAPEAIRVLAYQRELPLSNNTLFSYVMNNYWHTNYKAGQGGDFTFRYAISTKRGRAADSEIIRFGQNVADSLKPMWAGQGSAAAGAVSFMSVSPANVRILGVKTSEDGKGLTVRLQEMDGVKTHVKVSVNQILKVSSAFVTNLLEENPKKMGIKRQGGELIIESDISPRAMLTLKLM